MPIKVPLKTSFLAVTAPFVFFCTLMRRQLTPGCLLLWIPPGTLLKGYLRFHGPASVLNPRRTLLSLWSEAEILHGIYMRASCSLSSVAALVLLLAISCRMIQAQPAPGAIALTGLDSIAGTMTLLGNGRVLFAAGGTTTAQLYDPVTMGFLNTGSMDTARTNSTHVLLQDGRVLFAGGFVNNQPLTSAEIYDPASGTFSLTGSMPAAYSLAMAAAPLPDGHVLIVGNGLTTATPHQPQTQTSAIFDPTTGTFSPTDPIPMLYPVATPLADGRILFVGVTLDQSNNVAFLYDPATSSFRLTGSTAPFSIFPQDLGPGEVETETTLFGTSLLANGDVLLVGGEDRNASGDVGSRKTAEIYDPLTETFRQTGSLPLAMASPTATTLPSGLVLVTGAEGAALHDPALGQFLSLDLKTVSPAVPLPDGTVLVGSAYLYVQSPYVVSSASFTSPVAAGSFATMFAVFGSSVYGAALAPAPISAPNSQSPPTTLGGVSVLIRDRGGKLWSAPVLYVSPTQINFEVPTGLAPGNALIAAGNANGSASTLAAIVTDVAPGLFTLPNSTLAAAYAIRIEPDGSQTILAAGAPIPLDQRPVYLCLFGTGIRGLSSMNGISASIGGVNATVSYAGPQDSIPGLDQVNVLIPPSLKGAGYVTVQIDVDLNNTNTVVVDLE
jgi:uncharacterized protein (TIGR03437 family)